MTLQAFFETNPRVAIAFSGGVDSAYLLYAATRWGAEVSAYYVKSAFQPTFELEDAKALAQQLGARMKILPVDILCQSQVTANTKERCYYCKQAIFQSILEAAKQDGFSLVLDGTNASDDAADRPGMRALKELCVRSPLREYSLTKDEIRRLSKEAGLFTWNKSAYACLATRIASGEEITEEKLAKTEYAEDYLHRLGFRNFRVRLSQDVAKLQVSEADLSRVFHYRTDILKELGQHYRSVTLDLEVRDE